MAPSRLPNAKRPKCKGKEVSRPHSLPHRGPAQPPREVHVLETLSFLQRLLWDRKPTLSTRVQNMPPIDPDLLDLARRSPFLNDRLRTTGYRVINVIVASIIAEGPCGPNRRQRLLEATCSKDTLGRLSYIMNLHDHASTSESRRKAIARCSLTSDTPVTSPFLAMLFHALVGAIFVQYDLDTVYQWLEITFRTLVISANMDFTKRFGHGDGGHDFEPLRNAGFDQPRRLDETIKADACLFTLAFIQTYAFEIGQEGKPATDLLKNNNIGFEFWKEDLVGDSLRHSEIGDHLLALWVSEICVKKYPQDRTTNQNKKPSVLLGDVLAVMTDTSVLATLGSLLDVENRNANFGSSVAIYLTDARRAAMFRACLGWFHHLCPEDVHKWGRWWLRPIVLEAYDTLLDFKTRSPSQCAQKNVTKNEKHKAVAGARLYRPSVKSEPVEDSTISLNYGPSQAHIRLKSRTYAKRITSKHKAQSAKSAMIKAEELSDESEVLALLREASTSST